MLTEHVKYSRILGSKVFWGFIFSYLIDTVFSVSESIVC